jgi:hypothetical protein
MFLNHNVSRDGYSLFLKREEPFLETLWLRNIGTTDKVQRIDRSKELSGSINGTKCRGQLVEKQLLKKDYALWRFYIPN